MLKVKDIEEELFKEFGTCYKSLKDISKKTDQVSTLYSMFDEDYNYKLFDYDTGILGRREKIDRRDILCSVDAIDIKNNCIYFIEFKDGNVFSAKKEEKFQIRLKMIESILEFIDILKIPNLSLKNFLKLKRKFILVYNEENAYKVNEENGYKEYKIMIRDKFERVLKKYGEDKIYSKVILLEKNEFIEKYLKK